MVTSSLEEQNKIIHKGQMWHFRPSSGCRESILTLLIGKGFPIPNSSHRSGRDAKPNKVKGGSRESNVQPGLFDKIPLQVIIGFFKVNLNCHPTFLPFFVVHRVKDLLRKHYVIIAMTFRSKGTLSRTNQLRDHSLIRRASNLIITL